MRFRFLFLLILGIASIASAANFTYIQTNFTAGEFTPLMDGRVDFPKYFNAAKTLDNVIIYPQGGVTRRPGFEYIATAKTSPNEVRLIPFEFSTTQAYIIEMGDQYMRFYMDGGVIRVVDSDTKLLIHMDGNDNSVSFTDDGDTGHTVTNNGSNVKVETSVKKFGSGSANIPSDGGSYYLTVPADHADWDFLSTDWTVDFWYQTKNLTDGTGLFGLYSHYDDSSNVSGLYFVRSGGTYTLYYKMKSADVNLVALESEVTMDTEWHHYAVERYGNVWTLFFDGVAVDTDTVAQAYPDYDTTFTIGAGQVGVSGLRSCFGYIDEFRVSSTSRYDGAGFTPAVVAYPLGSGGAAYEIATPYLTEDLRDIKYVQSADTMWLVHEDYKPRKLTRSAHTTWTLSSYAPTNDPFTSSTTYPSAAAFFEERLCFGGFLATPQGLWLSVSGDFEDFTDGANDDDAMLIEIAADQVNTIRWLEPGRILAVGTVGGEWKLGATSLDDPITPSNIAVRRETAYGSSNVQPITIGKNILFVQRQGKKVREFGYDFDVDGYISHDLNILAEHIIDSPLVDIAYQQEPYSILWCVTEDGKLLSLTYQKDHEVVAWAEHPVGGTDVEVKSVAVIPGDGEDEVWISVERDLPGVNGTADRLNYIERMKPIFSGTDTTDAFFVDSGLSYDGGAVTSVSGLDHLEGQTVSILADGTPLTDTTVSSGSVSLGGSYSTVHVGLSYNSNVETLRTAIPSEGGSTIQGKEKSISHVSLRLYQTLECKIGPDSSNLDPVDFDDGTTTFTGDKRWPIDMDTDTYGYIYVRQDKPLPFTLLAIVPEVTTE